MKQKPALAVSRLRCAIYTRKSSEEGLDQSFNSLDAQREACEAYVMSQIGEGWSALPARYDDGGYSGGSMERPGLKRLLADIARGQVDIVVVYKVDRLTRSLADFARIVDAFDNKGVSFVSVTQAFNTTTSMGRLTLNVLLSFAQFEREVTGERIRDKIAASKKKGMWMGGVPPLGYRANGRTLAVDEAEARTVRHIFERYLALGSVHALRDELEAQGIRSRPSKRTVEVGGAAFTRGQLYHLLSNRVYVGEIVHKDASYPGQHVAIIDRKLFDRVAEALAINRRDRAAHAVTSGRSPLTGLIFDGAGRPMTPVSTRNRHGRVYRYYVSAPLQLGTRRASDVQAVRLPALAIEAVVLDRLAVVGAAKRDWSQARPRLVRVDVDGSSVTIAASAEGRLKLQHLPDGEHAVVREDGCVEIYAEIQLRAWAGRTDIVRVGSRRPASGARVDPALVRGLARAHALVRERRSSQATSDAFSAEHGAAPSYIRRLSRLAFLAPDIQQAIVDGRQPRGVTMERLMRIDVPMSWAHQRRELGFNAA